MNYGWATVFTLAAWFAGLVIDVNVRVGDPMPPPAPTMMFGTTG